MKDLSTTDIHRILGGRHQIAIVWCIEDVQSVRADLTEDQAWEVLQFVDRTHDANLGINWDCLECAAQILFGWPVNDSDSEIQS